MLKPITLGQQDCFWSLSRIRSIDIGQRSEEEEMSIKWKRWHFNPICDDCPSYCSDHVLLEKMTNNLFLLLLNKMAILTDSRKYRKDIDGLRAIAVLAVIIFHFGHLPNGYLGVDVFFVVSGYLITGIIYQEICKDRFSISNFYLRRTRRIIPLVLFLSLVSMIIGIIIMLPDDLENLAQSIIATNIFIW